MCESLITGGCPASSSHARGSAAGTLDGRVVDHEKQAHAADLNQAEVPQHGDLALVHLHHNFSAPFSGSSCRESLLTENGAKWMLVDKISHLAVVDQDSAPADILQPKLAIRLQGEVSLMAGHFPGVPL